MTPKHIAALIITILAAIIIVQNLTMATVSILFISISMPVAILCVVMFLLGVLAGGLLSRSRGKRVPPV